MKRPVVLQKKTAQDLAVLSNGTYNSGKGQAFDDYLWDTILMPTAPRQLQFFKANISSAYGGGQKTEIETSMEDTGKLPAGQGFLISAITVSFCSNIIMNSGGSITGGPVASLVNAYRMIMTNSVWELKFTNVEFSWRDSGSIFLPSVFEVGPTSATNNVGQRVGEFFHYNWIKVATKVPVSELVSFSVNARFGSGDPTISTLVDNAWTFLYNSKAALRVQLKGLQTRAI